MKNQSVASFILCVGAALAASPLASQSAPADKPKVAPAIKIETRVVLVDVVVTDDQGDTVAGLTKNDFQLTDEGAPQLISAFEEHKGVQPVQIKLPPMPPNVFTNFPTASSGDSVNIVLLDLLNTQPGDQAFARAQISKYLTTIPPGTRLAVFTLGTSLHMVRGFTTDFSGLSAALDDKKLGVQTKVSPLLPTASGQEAENLVGRQMRRSNAAPMAIGAVEEFQAYESGHRSISRAELTLQAIQQLAGYLSGIPARKNLIWFSGHFPVSLLPDSKVRAPRHQENIQRTSDMLTAAQVAIYPVSPLGLLGDPTFDVSNIAGTRADLENMSTSNQILMEELAKDTGGHAYYNTNGLEAAIKDAVSKGSHYYTLAYSPAIGKFDGTYRRIRVSLARGKYHLAYRNGYYADKPRPEVSYADQEEDPLMPLVGLGMPDFNKILYKVRVSPKTPQPSPKALRAGSNTDLKPPFTRYEVEFAVSLPDITMTTEPNGTRRGQIEVMLIAFDQDGKILNILKRRNKLTMDYKTYAATKSVGLQIREEIDVPPGEVYMRAGIFDLNSGNCGTVGIPLGTVATSQAAAKK